MLRPQFVPALILTLLASLLFGIAYPIATYGIGLLAFRHHADGSLITRDNRVVGSSLLGQSFADAAGNPLPAYFQPRPSAGGYNGVSGATNLGPGDRLLEAVAHRAAAYRAFNNLDATTPVPVDAVTSSGSGLDPDISLANAELQAARVAAARRLPFDAVMAQVRNNSTGRMLGFLGEPTVNVVQLNLALDEQRRP